MPSFNFNKSNSSKNGSSSAFRNKRFSASSQSSKLGKKDASKGYSTDSFNCKKCGKKVFYKAPGTKNRNHCPFCLFSLHVDTEPGDRKSTCGGLMEPIGKLYKPDGEEVLVHKCLGCGFVRKNRIAGDDDWNLVANLALIEHL